MRTHTLNLFGLAALLVLAPGISRADDPSSGLWVGNVTLTNVNETVVGIDAANNVVAPDPSVTTPVSSPASLRIIFHVDAQGNVSLLKSVAILDKSTNSTPNLALITDPTLYPNFTGVGKRIATTAYDFGEANAYNIVNQIATNAAIAAATGGNPTTAANKTVQGADVDAAYSAFVKGGGFMSAALGAAASAPIGALQSKQTGGTAQQITAAATAAANNNTIVVTNLAYAQTLQAASVFGDTRYVAAVQSVASAAANAAATDVNTGLTNSAAVGADATNAALAAVTAAIAAPSIVSAAYKSFIATPAFQSAAGIAGTAAAAGAAAVSAGATQLQVQNAAQAAALLALSNNGVYEAVDALVVNEIPMNGSLSAGGNVTGTIYLGANHPTNPFRHRMHPDHTTGYTITRALNIQFTPLAGTNLFQTAGLGVSTLTGTYREEISGLHKPLGQLQNIGLITDGFISLNRISTVDVLNQ